MSISVARSSARRMTAALAVLASMWTGTAAAEFADYEIPLIPYESVPNFLKYPPEMNLGEVLAVAVNSTRICGSFLNTFIISPVSGEAVCAATRLATSSALASAPA